MKLFLFVAPIPTSYENDCHTNSESGDVSFYFRTFIFRFNSYIACRNK